MIIDASVLLAALFPDESQAQAQAVIRDHVSRQIALTAPTLLHYEISNAVWQGVRRQRIEMEQARTILRTFDSLDIELEPVSWEEMLPWAQRFERSAYDAAYLGLAARRDEPLITGDARLYHAVQAHLSWVAWVGDYQARTTF